MIDTPEAPYANQRFRIDSQRVCAMIRPKPRVLIRPEPGYYVLRSKRSGTLIPAVIYQRCPMVMPQPDAADGPHPDDWCRPLDRSAVFLAQANGGPVSIDRVWTARSLRPVSAAEYAFRIGPLRQWAQLRRLMPETPPYRRVDLATLPPLY
jgi:hypothetical protein